MMTVVTHFAGRSVTYLERVLSLTKFQIAYIFFNCFIEWKKLLIKNYFERFKKGSQKDASTKIFILVKCKSNLVTGVIIYKYDLYHHIVDQ
jgi:hypothetical protein